MRRDGAVADAARGAWSWPAAGAHRPTAKRRHVVAQARIVDAVLREGAMAGTAGELARRLDLDVRDLLVALGELTGVGWITVRAATDGGLGIDWAGPVAEM